MDAVIFILFSTIEVLAYFYISFVMFRYKISYFKSQVIIFSLLVATISYLLHADTQLGAYVPFFSLLVLVILTFVLLRERFIFTVVMAVSGYIVFMLVQSLLALIVVFTTGVPFNELGDVPVLARAMQLLTAVTLLGMGRFLYRKGLGFTFTLKRMSSKWEYPVILTIISVLWIQLAVVMFIKNLFIATIFFLVGFAVFLYYGIKKEINLLVRKE